MIQKMKETIEQTLPINKIPRPISSGSSSSNNSSKKSNRKSSWHIANTSSIQNQQQLLILLFHARTCPEQLNNNCCPIAGSECHEAKRMWKHIAEECRDKYNCSHCYTSRYVLTHYRECRDGESCLICSPVREEIKRRKQLQLQKQQQQQIMKTADTFSTSMMTPSTTGITTAKVNNVHQMPNNNNNNMGGDTNNINEAGGNHNGGNNNAAAAGGGENQKLFPTLTVAICPSADNPFGKIIPVRKASFSSCSSLSHSTTYSALSRGSSSGIPSSIRSVTRSGGVNGVGGNGNGGRTKPYFVKDRENPGIAHFLGKD
jgi:hypothetical protein